MGVYNCLYAELECPFCKLSNQKEIEIKIGFLNLIYYKLGNKIEWTDGLKGLKGKRPLNGDLIGEGYVVCDPCDRDFWVDVVIKNDIIVQVTINKKKEGYTK